ncbi:tripartite tricarboxylate transporter substrate-binding protein [Mesorhizobium sp. LHD-90]|uniref:tripartite tricarboxylate transporter substrate-binding protein n=1 Tax=Mesorhizobium sp. LHD-90 TaxID=3071414 RepID=UPI0027DF81C4|nr:tripartite tricarboxylate transporter substrate-binding protein [Mesorhizobium sp. LHD-90]MDQ6435213.1 tripartite tricarboxylate transporter substrate-binding protein [Mesorhizobium sp. LHD-90]
MTSAPDPAASAHVYPTRPVRIIEPFGAGGGPDLLARALAPKLSSLWGQPVTVENLPGAGATAAPALVAKSPADGHTLLISTSAQAYGAALLKDLPYDPLNDFTPIIPLTRQGYVLVTGRATGVTTVGGLIAAARAGELRFGSTGIGTGTHVGVEKFNQAAAIKALHLPPSPNDSNADTIANAIAGRFTYYLVPISLALSHIRDGTLVALGVSTARRSTLLPEVPTIAEAGVAGFDFPIWYGMWVSAGTPAGVVDKLAYDIGRVLAGPDLREWIAKHGGEPMSMTQPEFERFVESESEGAARLMKAASVKPSSPTV